MPAARTLAAILALGCFVPVTAVLLLAGEAAPADPKPLTKAKIPAFPGAEGAGAWTPGGRGGKVFVVSNLNDGGRGSLREAVEAKGPRMVVFRVAGIITLKKPLAINHPFITIAGQSAPGDGVCIRGATTEINTHDVVIRYLRFRRGNLKKRDDALGGNPVGNVIIDHVSASWGLDENLSLYRYIVKEKGGKLRKMPTENLTIQWSISSEALDLNNHAFGGTWGGKNCSFHHNLFACNTGRNPSIGMGGPFDFRNNVLFNWRHRTIDGGDGSSRVNVVNNYFKPGPVTRGALRFRICKVQARVPWDDHPGFGKWYVAGNYVAGSEKVTADNWAGGVQYAPPVKVKGVLVPMGTEKDVRSKVPFPAAPVRTQKAADAYEAVLAYAGASLPRRDAVDERVLKSVRTGKTGTKTGIIDTPADVGGWPEYRPGRGPDVDSDGDGMPDWWEKMYGLDPNDPSDAAKDKNGDGYTNLEKYLNGIDPTKFVDYTKPENNVNPLHKKVTR
jgi:pectate lyase